MKLRYKPMRAARMGLPEVGYTRNTVRGLNNFILNYPGRIERAVEMFVLELAGWIRHSVQSIAPDIGGFKYAEDLRIGVLGEVNGEYAVSIYLESENVKVVKLSRDSNLVLFIRPRGNADRWIFELSQYGWPAAYFPIRIDYEKFLLIAREATDVEIADLLTLLGGNAASISSRVEALGGPKLDLIQKTDYANGAKVSVDIGFEILRQEFGYGKAGMHKHWRTVLGDIGKQVRKSLEHYVDYVVHGHPEVFDIPDDLHNLALSQHKQGIKFQNVIAPFGPRGKIFA